jgi:hypothetical protein
MKILKNFQSPKIWLMKIMIMDLSMKVINKMEKDMERANLHLKMEVYTMECGKKTKCAVMVCFITKIKNQPLMENGWMTNFKEVEFYTMKVDIC